MKRNDIRVTYAVDLKTVQALGELADAWSVSKSEAMRRAVRLARERLELSVARMTPSEALAHAMHNPTRTRREIEAWQSDARAHRKAWRRKPARTS